MSSPVTTLMTPSLLPPDPLQKSEEVRDRHLVLLAAGTGVVPMLQVAQSALQPRQGVLSVTLLYSCKTLEDCLCWTELRTMEAVRASTPEAPAFRIWLALSSGAGASLRHEPPLVGTVHRR